MSVCLSFGAIENVLGKWRGVGRGWRKKTGKERTSGGGRTVLEVASFFCYLYFFVA